MKLLRLSFSACLLTFLPTSKTAAQIRPAVAPYELVIETGGKANVSFDGKVICPGGTGRCVVRNPKPGVHLIRVEQPPCRLPFTQKVTVVEGQSSQIRAQAVAVTGDLQVFTTNRAQIEVDGRVKGIAGASGDLTIRGLSVCDTHRVAVSLPGYSSGQSEATVAADVVSTVTIELRKNAAPEQAGPVKSPEYRLHRRLAGPSGVEPIAAFRSDGKQLVTWTKDDARVIVWESETGRQLRTISVAGKRVLAASPDLHRLAVTPAKGMVQILDLETGEEIVQFRAGASSLGNAADNIAFSPDGKRLAAVSETSAGVWDLDSGKQLFSFPEDDSIGYTAYCPGARRLITGRNGIAVWDADTGVPIRRYPGKLAVHGLALSPDGRLAAAISYDEHTSRWQANILDAATGAITNVITPEGDNISFQAIAFTPDSQFLLGATSDSTLRIWDSRTAREVRRWPVTSNGAVWSIAISPDGEWIATCTSLQDFLLWRKAP